MSINMTTPKRDNYRFTFLLKLECPEQLPTAEFASNIAEGATPMLFTRDEHTVWLHIAIDPLGKPLSRKFFSEKACRGAKLIASAGFLAIETPATQVDTTLIQLAADSYVTGLNEAAATWLSQKRASAVIVTEVTTRSDTQSLEN